jgi:hypothetical protein
VGAFFDDNHRLANGREHRLLKYFVIFNLKNLFSWKMEILNSLREYFDSAQDSTD